jgi:hypothetical protein
MSDVYFKKLEQLPDITKTSAVGIEIVPDIYLMTPSEVSSTGCTRRQRTPPNWPEEARIRHAPPMREISEEAENRNERRKVYTPSKIKLGHSSC